MAGALACSFIAFATNKLVLSQRENHMLIFSLLAIVVFLSYAYAKNRARERGSYKSQPYYRTKRDWSPSGNSADQPLRAVA